MAEIKCPMCGKPNPAELAVCQYCEARLKPLTDELSRSQPPIRPGEEPQAMDTGQLERTLPGWLRDIRQQARDSAGQESGKPAEQQEKDQPKDQADFLAGLRSQSKGEEEVPDWLAGLRSEGGQVGFEESTHDEDDMAALRNMLGEEAPSAKESQPGAFPDPAAEAKGTADEQEAFPSGSDFRWEADFGTEPEPGEEAQVETPFDSELPAWLSSEEPAQAESESRPSGDENELPAWLQDTEISTPEATDTGLPAWLASLDKGESGDSFPSEQKEEGPGIKSTTDWLASFDKKETGAQPPQDTDSAIKSTTDWLASLEDEAVETDAQQEPVQPAAESEAPDWLSALGTESQEPVSPSDELAPGNDLPGWLGTLGEENDETFPQEETPAFAESERPDWLDSLAEQSKAEQEGFEVRDESVEPTQAPPQTEFPDWLAALGEETAETEPPAEELDFSKFASDAPVEKQGPAPAFVDDEGKPISQEDVEAIFSMDMPDWLSETGTTSPFEEKAPVEEEQAEELHPAELPSWVQAMRPVESVISQTEEAASEAQPVEERGPLAGLRGVLPATTGIGAFSKPKGYSFKLQVSEDQQSSAALLESILAEEVTPKPVPTQKVVLTQRILRWVIAALLLLVVGATVYISPQINPVPAGVPLETSDAWNYIQTLPTNAPVLLVFDYEAARAGELEATAAPLIDQMLTLKAPRLTLVSSTPVGSGLAERFVGILQSDRPFVRNENFVNLGYLPGGAAGVQAFAGNPTDIKPLTTSGEAAWTTAALQGVEQLSQFQAIFLLTDNIETARIWIEQTEGLRGEARFLVISSAQSAPMILPYERSGQVLGMVTGLEGGAPIEQANSGRPGMALRYWDAFGFGLLMAVIMITVGSLWNLVAGWRSLRKEQGEG